MNFINYFLLLFIVVAHQMFKIVKNYNLILNLHQYHLIVHYFNFILFGKITVDHFEFVFLIFIQNLGSILFLFDCLLIIDFLSHRPYLKCFKVIFNFQFKVFIFNLINY